MEWKWLGNGLGNGLEQNAVENEGLVKQLIFLHINIDQLHLRSDC